MILAKDAHVTHFPKSVKLRYAYLLLMLIVGLMPMVGCSGTVERKWSEEVALDDGRVIVIDRYVMFKKSNSLAGDAYNATDLTSRLEFQGELKGLPSWIAVLVPILLYHDAGAQQWVVVATTSNCETWYQQGAPVPPYWEYRTTGDKWVQNELSEGSIGRNTNLYFSYEAKLPPRTLSLQSKQAEVKEHNYAKKYLTIIGALKSNCGYAPK